jgi:hypothetical protein
MTKKDYELIASVLRANYQSGGEETIIWELAEALENADPKFKKASFLLDCGGSYKSWLGRFMFERYED